MRIIEVIKGIEKPYTVMSDVDRPRLTLRHLNALRKLRAQREAEMVKQLELAQWMYGADTDCDEDGRRNKSIKPIKPIKTIKPFELFKPTRRQDE